MLWGRLRGFGGAGTPLGTTAAASDRWALPYRGYKDKWTCRHPRGGTWRQPAALLALLALLRVLRRPPPRVLGGGLILPRRPVLRLLRMLGTDPYFRGGACCPRRAC